MGSLNKLALGTVQFGCQYGLNSVQPTKLDEVQSLLEFARESGIHLLDTSPAYGNAEEVLGKVSACDNFEIVSKYSDLSISVEDSFNQTLSQLGAKKLFGYLIHYFDMYQKCPNIWDDFLKLKSEGKVAHIGFSLYEPSELELLINRKVDFDILQIPMNILDRQFEPYLKELHDRGVILHVRSVFLQGLFFKNRNELPERLLPLRKYLYQLDDYAKANILSVGEIALNYIFQNPYVDNVIVGVHTKEQLTRNIGCLSSRPIDFCVNVSDEDVYLLKPKNWN
ncbi:MAG: aldo/keto reductase [Bacteroidaceae bacterium]|nr:aldo/keto reductase [Bacteroidaceae bacterium]